MIGRGFSNIHTCLTHFSFFETGDFERVCLIADFTFSMTGREFSAKQAAKLNLVTKVSDSPLDAAKKLAEEIAQQSPDAVAGVKKLYKNAWWHSKGFALARESWYQIKVMAGKNQRIKTFNQTNPDNTKPFKSRGNW